MSFHEFAIWVIFKIFWELLSQQAIGNLFLLFAAIVGVIGSFLLYTKRRRDDRNNLRLALIYEISALEDDDLVELKNISAGDIEAAQEIAPTTIFESNADNLGLLTVDEIRTVVRYYTAISTTEDLFSMQLKGETDWNIEETVDDLITSQRKALTSLQTQFMAENPTMKEEDLGFYSPELDQEDEVDS